MTHSGTPFFDMLFGTHREPGRVRVPERFAMRWLVDPVSGEIWPQYREDYELRRSPRRGTVATTRSADLDAAYAGQAPADA